MPQFRTKGRGKDRQVFPVSGGKEYRRNDDYKENPPEEKVLEEKIQEQKAEKKHKLAKPSFSTRSDVRRDIKNIMRKEDSDEHGSKDYLNYRKKLDRDTDRAYSKENRKAKKRRKKETKKVKKQEQRQDADMREQST